MGNVWNRKLQLQVDEAGWGKTGAAQTVLEHLIMKHLRGPLMMDTVYYSVRVQGLTFSLKGQCVLECFSNTVTVCGAILRTGDTVIMLCIFNNFTFILIC